MKEQSLIDLCGVSCVRTEAGVRTEVRDVSLSIVPGSRTLLTGEVGCGKNLLLRLLGMIEVPDAGDVRFENESTLLLTEDARAKLRTKRCGYVFPTPFLLPAFTVMENIAMPVFKILKLSFHDVGERTEELMEFCGLKDVARQHSVPVALQHRVALARALIHHPAALFVDGLDLLFAGEELAEFRALLAAAVEKYQVAVVATAQPEIPHVAGERRVELTEGRIACEVAL